MLLFLHVLYLILCENELLWWSGGMLAFSMGFSWSQTCTCFTINSDLQLWALQHESARKMAWMILSNPLDASLTFFMVASNQLLFSKGWMKYYQSRKVDMEGRRVIPSLGSRWSSPPYLFIYFFLLGPCVKSLCSCPEFFHWICMPINYWSAGPLTVQTSDLMREKGGGHPSPQVTLWFLTCQGESIHLNPLQLFLKKCIF